MQIKIHRGTHRIGGCITEIKTARARIIIDMGEELPPATATESKPFEIEGVTCGAPDCDAVLITHYHGDHAGMFEKVLPQIPVYMGSAAKQIYCAVQNVLKDKLGKGNPERVSAFREFSVGRPLCFKDIKVTPYVVDHSAFDAYMLLIEAEGKRILHTGDFRMHGARGRKMPQVFEKYAANIDVLISEGTMLSRGGEKPLTEHELGARAAEILKAEKSVFVLCSSTNIDTIAQFYNAAAKAKKPFIVCDGYQTEILRIVTANSTSPFYNFNRKKIYSYGKNMHPLMSKCGFVFMGRTNFTTGCALEAFPDSLLIYSMWRGYLDKAHAAFDEYKSNFIERARNSGCRIEYLHTSGHATADDLKLVCNVTKAKTVIPVHSEAPEKFKELGLNTEIKILQDGEVYNL